MVTKLKKEETVKDLREKFERAKSVYTAEPSGLTVVETTELRRSIKPTKAEYKVAKNTLISIASKGTAFEELTKELVGPTALLFCYEDGVSPAGKVKSFAKEHGDKIKIKGAVLDGELLDAEKATAVAGLPSKEILLSQIAGMLVAPASSIAYILQELGNKDEKDKLLKEFISV